MIDRFVFQSRCAQKALIALFCVSGVFSALADGENFTFPVAHPANDKYTARLHDGTKTNTVSWGNKVKLTVLQGKVFAVTANEMIVARRTLKFKIEPIKLEGWNTSTDPYEETRDLRNNNNGNVFNNFNGVTFIEEHADPDDGMINGWEWMMPYVRVADLQVDSLNENLYGDVSGSDQEDAQEDTDQGGKILGSNAQSYTPGKPGWADFSGAPGDHPSFAKMVLFLQGFPSGTKVRFQYSGSDPSTISQDNEGNWILPQNGCLRVWAKNVYQNRNINNDYIKPNVAYTLEDLQAKHAQQADGHFVFYVEAVKAGTSVADNQVTVEVQAPNSSWATLDTVRLLPVQFLDSKDATLNNGNDISIMPKKDINDKSLSSVAWIEPHGAANGKDPAMPYLALRCPGTEQMNLKIKWKLKVEYKRPSGRTLAEDTVTIQSGGQAWTPEPFNGTLKFYDNADWKTAIGNQSDPLQAGRGFFGGNATLTWQLMKAGGSVIDEQTILFRIAGKNPDDTTCRQYIDQVATDMISQADGLMWYAYAIAKSETKDEGGEPYYNQFLKRGAQYHDKKGSEGVPDWNQDDEGEPGGYGIKQVTGYKGNEDANVPRSVIWNWEHNVDEGMRELAKVNKEARSWMQRQRSQATKPLPAHQVLNVIFSDGTNHIMEDAVAIKRYNAASKREAPDSYTDPAGGFTFTNETPRSGHYCYWDNARDKWSLSRWNNPPPPTSPFIYVNRVCQEVDP